MRSQNPTAILLSTTVPVQAFTSAFATDIFTSNGHGLVNGDQITVTTATALPAGMSLTTVYYVISATTNTFKLSTTKGGSSINITDNGTGTHTYHLLGRSIFVEDFQHINLSLDTKGTSTFTLKFVGSFQETAPIWSLAQSETNQYDYIDVIDYQNGASIDGDTGISPSGADDHRVFEMNVNGLRWISAIFTAYTQGTAALVAKPFTNQ